MLANSILSQGPAQIREKVRSIPSRDQEAPFVSCLLTLGPQNCYTGSQWVGGGKLDTSGVRFQASSLFSGAAKGLELALVTDLDVFDFPLSGSNFSSYREVPFHVPVVAYMATLDGQGAEIVSWEKAKELGCREFSVRLVVMPVSTKQALVQLGAAPFSLDEMKEDFGEVHGEPFFPNIMLRVSKEQMKLPAFMGARTSSLVKSVELVLEDTEGAGLGLLPFSTCPVPGPAGVQRPPPVVIKQAVYNHMRAGFQPVACTPGRMREALGIALQADKAPQNVLPPLWSPWPALASGTGSDNDQGTRPYAIAWHQVMMPGRVISDVCIARSWLGGTLILALVV